jgi:L,D-transpeptidase catalytic domain
MASSNIEVQGHYRDFPVGFGHLLGTELSTISTRRLGASSSPLKTRAELLGGSVLSGVSALGVIMTLVLALGVSPAAARTKNKALHKEADRTGSAPFGDAPKGPVQIFVSIDQQKLHVYSDGTHVADTSVATGVPRLPTPTGVFSVIQKQVFHRSNLYSDAPMPFMQRITWSGVALHEGENIGHPASHGCIRMPGEFAARLYKFTRIGARVIVARGELKPTDFADPHLFVHKDMQAAAVTPSLTPSLAPSLPTSSGAVQTAQTIDSSKASDAGLGAEPRDVIAAKPADLGLRGSSANVTASFVLASDDAKPNADAAKPEAAADAPKPEAAKADAPKTDAPAAADAKAPAAPSADPKAQTPTVTGSTPAAVTPVIAAPEASAPSGKPADVAKIPPINKSPIAIFISRKAQKIFVRQDFEPVFEEAITIAHPEEPMGTHVFTAMEYLADNATFRWNVVSMPGEPPKAAAAPKASWMIAADDYRYERHAKRRHNADQPTGELPAPQTPQQALARIDLPQDAIDFISQRMVPGSSLIVSDQGLGDETGEGTDFIVVTR